MFTSLLIFSFLASYFVLEQSAAAEPSKRRGYAVGLAILCIMWAASITAALVMDRFMA